jgi:hypothetical protein
MHTIPEERGLPLPSHSSNHEVSEDGTESRKGGSVKESCDKLFACPHSKRTPWEYAERQSCSKSGWTTIHRLRYALGVLLIVGLTVDLDNIFIAAIFCLSSARVARRILSPVRSLRATYMRSHVMTVAIVRRMSPSKALRIFYRKFDRQKPRQAMPRRKICGRLYIQPSFPMILGTRYPVPVSNPPPRVGMYLYSVS